MKKKNISLAIACCFIYCTLNAQLPLQTDVEPILKKIIVMPETVEELHTVFTLQTKYGEKFGDAELLNPIYYEVKQLVVTLHDKAIRERMKNFPRQDMTDTVQYEDERWKLAVRPPLSPTLISQLPKTDLKEKISIILDMQKVFDWQNFYKEQNKIDKEYRQKEAVISQESGMQMAKMKLELDKIFYTKLRDLWMNRYHRYSQGLSRLQQLLRELNYGTGLTAAEKKEVLPILADVQARALEAIEKLIWTQFTFVIRAELIYQDERIMNAYQHQYTQGR